MSVKTHNVFDVALVEKHNWNSEVESWCLSMELTTQRTLKSCTHLCRFGLVPVALVRGEI